MTRGPGIWWLVFAFGLAGTFFPHLLARDFLDDPGIVRWIAVPLLLVSSALLASYFLGIGPADLGLDPPTGNAI
jgi:hypothetical protein